MLVADIYNTNVFPISDGITIKDALQTIINKHFNGVVVVDKNKKLVGILSLQDIAGAIVPDEIKRNPTLADAFYKPNFFKELCKKIEGKYVKDIMRKEFITVTPETSVITVAADFLSNDLYMIPVMSENNIVGIITRSEIKKALAIGMEIVSK